MFFQLVLPSLQSVPTERGTFFNPCTATSFRKVPEECIHTWKVCQANSSCRVPDGLLSVDFSDAINQVTNSNLVSGKTNCTESTESRGYLSTPTNHIFNAAKIVFIKATEYQWKWCPLKDELLVNTVLFSEL